jgi:hypothetical protein
MAEDTGIQVIEGIAKWKLKNDVFWDVKQRSSCKSQRFGGT